MKRAALLVALLAFHPICAHTQPGTVEGRVVDGRTRAPLWGANVRLTNISDTAETYLTTSDSDGRFTFLPPAHRLYLLDVTYVGYAKLTKQVTVGSSRVVLGDLLMTPRLIPLNEVVVEGEVPPAIQKADTTEFNAGAFKTNPDADAEDLVAKMPGITVDNGSVKAQGEDVQQVLVDGKPFFGSDPTLALRNLPADAIEKIQVFDKMSDQAEFTGFDDGQSMKTINIITRRDRRDRQFGKSYAGYGDDARYLTGGGVNFFHGDSRLSLIGLSNNVNQQNFSVQDLLGVIGTPGGRGGFGGGFMGRRGGGGGGGFAGGAPGGGPQGGGSELNNFLIGQQNGMVSTSSIGENYSDSWGNRLTINQSYFFNLTDAGNDQIVRRQYFGTSDSTGNYRENSTGDNRNANHRVDMRIEYAADSSNSFIMLPKLYFQRNRSTSLLTGENETADGRLMNQTGTSGSSFNDGDNLTDHLVFRHKFETPGRTFSVDLGAGINRKNGTTDQQSDASYFRDTAVVRDTLDQQEPSLTDGYSLSSRLAYTEPVGGSGLVQLTYNPSFTHNRSDSRKYRLDPVTQQFTIPEVGLSNVYQSDYMTDNAGVAYRLRFAKVNLMAGVAYQRANLKGAQVYPVSASVGKSFSDILPNAMLMINIAPHQSLRVFYRTATKPPDISQLQDVVDNSNPLLLSAGNPDLRQSYTHTVIARYALTDLGNARSLFVFLTGGYTRDYVANATVIAGQDTLVMPGIRLRPGTQLTTPVNLDNDWNLRSFLTYSVPFRLIASNLNLISGLTYTNTPGLINGNLNLSRSLALTAGSVVSSNISEDVDFTLSYTGTKTISRNTLQHDLDSRYYTHTAGVKLNLIFLSGMVFRNEVNNVLYTGLSGGYNQDAVLWNLSLGRKFLSDQKGELRVGVTDLLNQNKSINRTVTETYVEDDQNAALGRYLMATFTYTIK